jgi:hypothetical protein
MTSDEITQQFDTLVLDGAFAPDQVEVEVAGGAVFAYTCKDPFKESENEDTVGVIPYGPGAAVLVVADGAGGLPAGKRASQANVRRSPPSRPWPHRCTQPWIRPCFCVPRY